MQLKVCSCARVISLLPKWTEGQKRAEKSEEAFYKPARATSNEMYKISLSSRVSPLQSWNQKKSLQGIAILKVWPLQALNNAFDSLIVLSFKGHETKNNQWCPEFENEKNLCSNSCHHYRKDFIHTASYTILSIWRIALLKAIEVRLLFASKDLKSVYLLENQSLFRLKPSNAVAITWFVGESQKTSSSVSGVFEVYYIVVVYYNLPLVRMSCVKKGLL